jgi:hypothetical protein
LCFSTIIGQVVASAFEAEYVAAFMTGQEVAHARQTLLHLGFPQAGPTPLQTDNRTARDIANRDARQRKSKAIDMRYHWTRDRVDRGELAVFWDAGTNNTAADFLTKAHPVHHFRATRPLFVCD